MASGWAIAGIIIVILLIIGIGALALSGPSTQTNSTTTNSTSSGTNTTRIGTTNSSTTSNTGTGTTTNSSRTTNSTTASSNTVGTYNTPVMMTDPPEMPKGTNAFVMTYSNVRLYENVSGSKSSSSNTASSSSSSAGIGTSTTSTTSSNTGSGSWVNATGTGSGTVNLTQIVNGSQALAYVQLHANSTISKVQYRIDSAYLVVNGIKYNVSVPNPNVTVNITGNAMVRKGSGVLLDAHQVASPIFTQKNATTFVLASADKAVVVGNVSASSGSAKLNATEMAALRSEVPNVTIKSASIKVSGKNTSINVTLMNADKNRSAVINQLLIYGPLNVSASTTTNATLGVAINGAVGLGGVASANVSASANVAVMTAVEIKEFQMLDFAVQSGLLSGDKLALVTGKSGTTGSGVMLSKGANATISLKNSSLNYSSSLYDIRLMPGQSYRLVAVGYTGAMASTNVTATGS